MAVKIGNSWVSEAALAYAKGVTNSGQSTDSDVLKSLSEKYKDTKFIASTEPFQGKGTNNIGISPNILRQMEQNPEKRLEYEALIYDCVQAAKNAPDKTPNGADIVASGFIINADGSLGGWSISKMGGEKIRHQTKLDKKNKESWQKKLYEKQREKAVKRKEQQKASVSFNEGKRARQLAAAKTVENVQMVMVLLQKDLTDCQAGLASGACDENEVAKVKAMIARAQQRMSELKGDGSASREEREDNSDFFSMNLLI